MKRTIVAAAAILLSTGLGLAAGIVPGSDTGTRDRQTAADVAVANGSFGAPAATTGYGYPVSDTARDPASATNAADDRAVDRAAGAAPATPRSALVPASDSF